MTEHPEPEQHPTPGTAPLEMVAGAAYRNLLGAELRLIEPAYTHTRVRERFAVMAPGLWLAQQPTPTGLTHWLVTAEGMSACRYTRLPENPDTEPPF